MTIFSEEEAGEPVEREEEGEEEEESIDIRSVRLSYLEKFIEITKTWSNILSGVFTVDELKKIRENIKESREKRGTRRRRSRAK